MDKLIIISTIILAMNTTTNALSQVKEHNIPISKTISIHAVDFPGDGTPFLMLHGFPDNKIIYDRLISELQQQGKRCIVFDFVGWGDSDKPKKRDYPYSVNQQIKEIEAVVNYFGLAAVRLVVHDMAGPPAIDFALANSDFVEELILLNTYYHNTKTRREPPTITMFSAPFLRHIFTPFGRLNFVFKPVFRAQMKPFFNDHAIRNEYVPLFIDQFTGKNHSKNALFGVISQVPKDVKANSTKIEMLQKFDKPVKVAFGSSDKYLGKPLAEEFAALFPNSSLHLIDNCNHYPQIEFPDVTASILVE